MARYLPIFKRFSIYFGLFLLVSVSYYIAILGPSHAYYGASAGYRVFEYLAAISNLTCNVIIGCVLGNVEGEIEIGSKGFKLDLALYHNYLLNYLMNLAYQYFV